MPTDRAALHASHVRRVRIFVSSPGDVREERRIVGDVVRQLGKEEAFRNHLALYPYQRGSHLGFRVVVSRSRS